jgi:dephospho-CoA kinase
MQGTGTAQVVGLTGGIASGKSTVAAMLRELGAPIVDADELGRRLVAPGTAALDEIRARFGAEVVAGDGTLDRKRLAEIIFADPAARLALNAITHPRIGAASQSAIADLAARGEPLVVYVAPLIVENQLYRWMQGLIVVTLPEEVQLARLLARDGLSDGEARARIAAQATPAERAAVATHLIDNSGALAETRAQVKRLWSMIRPAPPTSAASRKEGDV